MQQMENLPELSLDSYLSKYGMQPQLGFKFFLYILAIQTL